MRQLDGFALLVVFGVFGGCSNDWRTDMWYQPSLRPQAAPRPAPEGSVPIQGLIQADERDDLNDLKNPTPPDESSLRRGQELFETRCSACHGLKGDGNGPVSKVFPPAPNLRFDSIRRRTDGFLFATLTLGGRAMPAQRESLTVHDRWDVVNYVRKLQQDVGDAGAASTGGPTP